MDSVLQISLDEDGQDLIEYTLLLMFIALAAVLVLQQAGSSAQPIWAGGSQTLQNAAVQTS